MFLKTDNKDYGTGRKVVYFFLTPSLISVSSGVSTKWKWRSLGDLVWPWHCWPLLTFRSQCKGLEKVATVSPFIHLFMCFFGHKIFILFY